MNVPCKINLGLRILRRRPDGYHDLETLFLPVPFLHDDLEITPLDRVSASDVQFSITGITLDSSPADNLCLKAYRLLKADFPDLPPVQIRLHKVIPFGAGLGGGSADAAFTLKMLNELFHLGLTVPQLETYAARLGADCAFFVQCRPALAEGIGDILTPLDINPIKGLHLLLVKPSDSVSTKEAYARIVPHEPSPAYPSIKDYLATTPTDLATAPDSRFSGLVNDFEASVFPAHPAIATLKADLLALGASYAAMSGSGSTVFGLFATHEDLLVAADTLLRTRPDCLLFHE